MDRVYDPITFLAARRAKCGLRLACPAETPYSLADGAAWHVGRVGFGSRRVNACAQNASLRTFLRSPNAAVAAKARRVF